MCVSPWRLVDISIPVSGILLTLGTCRVRLIHEIPVLTHTRPTSHRRLRLRRAKARARQKCETATRKDLQILEPYHGSMPQQHGVWLCQFCGWQWQFYKLSWKEGENVRQGSNETNSQRSNSRPRKSVCSILFVGGYRIVGAVVHDGSLLKSRKTVPSSRGAMVQKLLMDSLTDSSCQCFMFNLARLQWKVVEPIASAP